MPADISYEEWVTHVFDHDDPNWHWALDAPYWNPEMDAARALSFLGRLFSNPEFLISRFSPNQIGVGLNFLVSSSCSSYGFVPIEHSLPIEERVQCVHDIATLYEKVFARICARTTHHGRVESLPGQTAADDLCYMFWDVFPMYGRTRNELSNDSQEVKQNWQSHCRIEAACTDAMERTLALDHEACQEGALHGLGHWQGYYPERVKPIIDTYLTRKNLDPSLVEYARAARKGSVL